MCPVVTLVGGVEVLGIFSGVACCGWTEVGRVSEGSGGGVVVFGAGAGESWIMSSRIDRRLAG